MPQKAAKKPRVKEKHTYVGMLHICTSRNLPSSVRKYRSQRGEEELLKIIMKRNQILNK